jgi:hypothetical protein
MSNPIERQYLSPNCILSLQGFSDDDSEQTPSSVMSVLVQAKCQIIGSPHTLQGGLTFLENLTKAISSYTQGLFSGLTHPWEPAETSDYIQIQKMTDKNRHLLIWQEEKDNTDKQIEIELSTIQLFDLQDAIDQFCRDENTLAQIQDEIKPLSRRYRQSEVTIVEQSTPAALGLVSFSLATLLLFFIPYPTEIKDPNLEPQPTSSEVEVIPPEEESSNE